MRLGATRKNPGMQTGQILPMVLVLLAAAVFIIVPALFSTQIGLGVKRDMEKDTLSYYAAEGGIADAVWKFNQGLTPVFPYDLSVPVNGMTVTVSQAYPPVVNSTVTTYTICSTAKLNGLILNSIYVTLDVATTGVYAFQYAVASTAGNIQIDGTINSTPANGLANVFANGNLTVTGVVNGSGYATGSITGCSKITGTCNQGTGGLIFQALDDTGYLQAAQQGKTYNGNLSLSHQTISLGPSPPNTYYSYINGNLEIQQSTVKLTGVVWVNGYIKISNSSNVTGQSSASQYYLFAHGTSVQNRYISVANNTALSSNVNLLSDNGYVTVANSADVASIYAPNGAVAVSGNANVTGAILGKSVSISGTRILNYPNSIHQAPFPGFTLIAQGVTIKSYSSQ